MCRLFGFRSSVPSQVHSSLVAAENALLAQSARHPDGWGVAFYVNDYPHLFRSHVKALEDRLFRDVSGVVSTYTLVAHVRRATVGEVGLLNCHPFQYGNWVFAHNGEIAGFSQDPAVREAALAEVDERFRKYIMGQTDSEVCFYAFLTRVARLYDDVHQKGLDAEKVTDALRRTVEAMQRLGQKLAGWDGRLTFLVTNGNLMLATRNGRELHYSTYKTLCPERDTCAAYEPARCEAEVKDGIVKHLLLTSEPIKNPNVWTELKDGEAVGVNWGMRFKRWTVD